MKKTAVEVLKNKKLKATKARGIILDVFVRDCEPINAENIFKRIKSRNIDQATVYRNLSALEKAGIIRRVDLRRDSVFYELADNHHHHIICTECGTTEHFDKCGIEELSKRVIKKSDSFAVINQHSLEFFGLCKPCSKSYY